MRMLLHQQRLWSFHRIEKSPEPRVSKPTSDSEHSTNQRAFRPNRPTCTSRQISNVLKRFRIMRHLVQLYGMPDQSDWVETYAIGEICNKSAIVVAAGTLHMPWS